MNKLSIILLTACGFLAGMCVGMFLGKGGNSFGCNNGTTYINKEERGVQEIS